MGRTLKWLKGFLGITKEKHKKPNPNSGVRQSCLGHSVREPIIETDDSLICQNPHTIPLNLTPSEAAWLKSFYSNSDKEQSRHAIAVAAATAAAADAAVSAAQAAAAVVRLTSQGAGRISGSMAGNGGGAGGREKWGATKIQTVFRGYLARKALRALKGLVKLQAIVRGYLVRKQADATFLSMQVLIRSAQTTIRAQRTRALINSSCQNCQLHHLPRNSLEALDEPTSKQRNSFHSRRISASSFDNTNTDINAVVESPKIVEMDTGRPKSRSRSMVSDSGDDDDGSSSHHTQSSPHPPTPPPLRLSIPEWHHSLEEHKWGDDCRGGYTTAQSTPRFATCGGNNSPITPAKSVCIESLFRNYGKYCPNYMADTQSFKAKLRSQSAPKQRPEQYPVGGPKRRQSIHEMMGSRNSLSGVKMQRSCSNAQEAINFKNAVISKLGRSTEFLRDQCSRDY